MKKISSQLRQLVAKVAQIKLVPDAGADSQSACATRPLNPILNKQFSLNNFDLLRILAATQVLVFHTLLILKISVPLWIAPFEQFPGVPIFFVISGYLISASYERSNPKSYFQNRILRIFSGLWVCLVFTVITASAFGFNFLHFSGLGWILAQMAALIYTPKFLANFGFGSYNGSLWTIPLELQFYCVLPLIYLLGDRLKSRNLHFVGLFAIFVAIALLGGWYLPGMGHASESLTEKLIRYTFVPHFFMFLAGCVTTTAPRLHDVGNFW